MNLSQAFGSLALVNYCNAFSGGTLVLYSGSIPATPETTATGTALYTFPFNTPGFVTTPPSFASGNLSLAASIGTGTFNAAGTAGYARAFSKASPAARANTTAYTRGTLITASSYLWVCTVGGTTSGTSTLTSPGYGILDGTAGFDYVGASTVNVCADFTVGTSGADVNLGNLSIQSGVTVSVTSFTLQVPAL